MVERAKLLGGTCEAGPRSRPWLDSDRGAATDRGAVSVTALVADDQEIVRTGLRMIIDAQPGIEVIGEAADGRTAVELARRLQPDVCLFDIRMPGLDGIEATRALAGPTVEDPLAVVVITTFDLDDYAYAALRAGARGFCSRTPVPPCSPRPFMPQPTVTHSSPPTSPPGCSEPSPKPRRDRPHGRRSRHSPRGRSRFWPRSHADGPTARSPTSCTSR